MTKTTRTVGARGQVVIPKVIRDQAGLTAGTEVLVQLRGNEVVLKRVSPQTGSYVDYFVSTYAEKLRDRVDIEKMIEEELVDRSRPR